jgi:hypothetical protein
MNWKFNEIIIEDSNDNRVFLFLKQYNNTFSQELIFIEYRKGSLELLWLGKPNKFWEDLEGHTVEVFDENLEHLDYWSVINRITYSRNDETRVIPKHIRYQILSEQHWSCNNCGCRLKYSKKSDWEAEIAHIDHIHPYVDRTTYHGLSINERQNLQALCEKCNLQKHNQRQ